MKNIKLWTALITPMKTDGSIHFKDLEKIVKRQESAGNGILLIGSTGEGLALSDDEKKSVVEHVSNLHPSVPIMVGVGGFNLESQTRWIESCNELNVDAFLLVSPLYSRPGPIGQTEWFNLLMDSAQKPCMIYNIPSRTGVKIPVEVLKNIESHKNFWSVKEASGSIDDYQAFRKACPDVPLYSGDDGLMPFFSRAGCSGLVSVSSNVWPEATRLYVKKCLSGDTESLFLIWSDAIRSMFMAPNPIPAKVLLKEKGVIETSYLRAPLTEREISDTTRLMKADELIINWYNLNKQ